MRNNLLNIVKRILQLLDRHMFQQNKLQHSNRSHRQQKNFVHWYNLRHKSSYCFVCIDWLGIVVHMFELSCQQSKDLGMNLRMLWSHCCRRFQSNIELHRFVLSCQQSKDLGMNLRTFWSRCCRRFQSNIESHRFVSNCLQIKDLGMNLRMLWSRCCRRFQSNIELHRFVLNCLQKEEKDTAEHTFL